MSASATPAAGPRVVVVVDRSGERLTADAAAGVARGWARTAPHTTVEAYDCHDGGAGLTAVVAGRLGATVHPVVVPGPAGVEVPAAVAVVPTADPSGAADPADRGDLADRGDRDPAAGGTAYLDTAQVAGRHLVPQERLADPEGLSSAGVGRLLRHARDLGVDRIVVGVGPLATHDGGVGLLRELGAGADLTNLPAVRDEWAGTRLVLVTTTESPLLGFQGASAGLGDHGVPPEVTQRLELRMGDLTDRVNAVLPPSRDLLTGLPRRPEREPGSGAGGGLGYALQLIGARTDDGARFLLDELGIRPRLAGSLLVLVTDRYDYTTVHDGVVAQTARAALESATPTVVLARQVAVGRREGMSLGVSGAYELREGEDLAALAARVARTWTPAR
ncbi:glycerate kinase [Ornithinimicrobium sufpigmenti]|uniref:glycerate kinase n=1 Tax=Ornithinimicrobium sufpigmenti TaxID=2508882 RepID=UPI0010364272|nr:MULTISPECIES: glycerate kinase [unclassified Ornithinimicrobium]